MRNTTRSEDRALDQLDGLTNLTNYVDTVRSTIERLDSLLDEAWVKIDQLQSDLKDAEETSKTAIEHLDAQIIDLQSQLEAAAKRDPS